MVNANHSTSVLFMTKVSLILQGVAEHLFMRRRRIEIFEYKSHNHTKT
jgi:hypothetical protein